MPKFDPLARKRLGLNGRHKRRVHGKHGPNFIQLFHYVKRSVEYHGLGPFARALLIEMIDRYNGSNNGFIILGVREAAYELHCNKSTISRAMRELDDAGLDRRRPGCGVAAMPLNGA